MIERRCRYCEGIIVRHPTERPCDFRERVFCSKSCATKWRYREANCDARTCEECGSEIVRSNPSWATYRRRRFCSRKCSTAYLTSHGDAGRPGGQRPLKLTRSFWSHTVHLPNGCLIWVGLTDGSGYSRWTGGDGNILAHRAAYAGTKGPIAAGLEIDHLCRVTRCVNPNHLEAVTPQENRRREWVSRREQTN